MAQKRDRKKSDGKTVRPPAPDALMLRIGEVAHLLGVSYSKARELTLEGAWPYRKVGARICIPAAGVRAWVEQIANEGQAEPETTEPEEPSAA